MPPPRRFAVFGHPVAHSLSPAMHAANFRALGLDAVNERRDVVPETVAAALSDYRSGGVNCTIPLKRTAYEACGRRDASAERFGVVNTVRFDADGGTTGFNTDGVGFLRALEEALRCTPAGRAVFVSGGSRPIRRSAGRWSRAGAAPA